jgi:hypothetical protein
MIVVAVLLVVAARAATIGLFGVFHVDLPAQFANVSLAANPFDPAQLSVRASASDGQTVGGFVYQHYVRSHANGGEKLTPTDAPHVAVRFVAKQLGLLCVTGVHVTLNNASNTFAMSTCVTVVASSKRGFVRVAANRQHFVFDGTDDAFVPVGENMCWSTSANLTYDYDQWVSDLGAVGGNYFRLWLNPPGLSPFALESVATGVGRYDLEAAWRLDYVLQLAVQNEFDFRVMLATQTFNCFSTAIFPTWNSNPYNAKNGGPLATPFEFFSDPTAQSLYKRSLSFLIDRFSSYTSVFAWEFFNEVDLVDGFDGNVVSQWHKEMASFVAANDPYDHLRTTSFAFPGGLNATWQIREISYTQTHSYNAADMIAMDVIFNPGMVSRFDKPTLMGEFGTSNNGATEYQQDPTGIALFNGMWAGLVTSAGSGFLWWWDDYVAAYPYLYERFVGVSAMARTLSPFVARYYWTFQEITVAPVRLLMSSGVALNSSSGHPVLMGLFANTNFTWNAYGRGVPTNPVGSQPNVRLQMPAAEPGSYKALFFNTTDGQPLQNVATGPIIVGVGGLASIAVPPTLTTSLFVIAVKTEKK